MLQPRRRSKSAKPTTFEAIYMMTASVSNQLGDSAKKKRRTLRSAAQFNAKYLVQLGNKVDMTVLASTGIFIVLSADRKLLETLPVKFGSFERGKIERVKTYTPMCF